MFFYNPGKLTVSPKPITVTIQNATSDYGEAPAELKATDNGIVNDDKDVYSLSTTATSTSNVGKYAITGAALDSNYNITFVNGEYEITKRKLTITVDEKNVVVNTELPAYTYKVEGLMGEDKLVTEPIFTCNADVTVIGEYDIIASGADAGGNYSINYVPAKLRILINTENIEKVKDVTSENVTLENKTDLEKAKADLKKVLDENGDNYTEDQKKAIEGEIKRIDDALEVIGNVEAVEKLIGKLPKEITKSDEASVLAAKKAFDTLSDYEKTLVLAEYKEVLKNAEETLAKLGANADTESPNTGEGSNVWVLFALMASIGSGILGITIRRKKKISL